MKSATIIAIQANIVEAAGNYILHFSKILDTYEEPEDDDTGPDEVHDEQYWGKKATWTLDAAKALLEVVKPVFDEPSLNLKKNYIAITYVCPQGRIGPRGKFVTFITYPDFKQEKEDAYELFAEIKKYPNGLSWYAEQTFYPTALFTVAAIGDGGDTALTMSLFDAAKLPETRQRTVKSG